MTPPLRHTLCEHALGNYRVLSTLANELPTTAAQRELSELDEKLYFEVFAPSTQSSRRTPARQPNAIARALRRGSLHDAVLHRRPLSVVQPRLRHPSIDEPF